MSGTTLLDYAVNAMPDPILASPSTGNPNTVTLEIDVSNSSGDTIICNSITVSFLTGGDAAELSSDTTGIGSSVPAGWNISPSGSLFTFTPKTEQDGQIEGQGLTFVLSNIKVNDKAGTCYLTITEDASDPDAGEDEEDRTATFPLSKFPPKFYLNNPSVDNSIINKGESVLLSWSGSSSSGNYTCIYSIEYENGDGDKVTIKHPEGQPNVPLPAVGSYEIDDAGLNPTIFYVHVKVQVQGLDHPLYYTKSVLVTVIQPKPAINSFTITANPIVSGQALSFTLGWTVSNIGNFQIIANDGPGGQWRNLNVPFSLTGTYVVYPTQLETTYTMQLLSSSKSEREEV